MLRFVVFLAIVIGVLGGMHYYLWVRLVRDTALSGGDRAAATIALALLGASIPASFLVGRLAPTASTKMTLWLTYAWLGLAFFLMVLLLAIDFARLVLWLA